MVSDNRVKVWDVAVRLFHWSLAAAFFVAYLSSEEWQSLHVLAGYGVAGLIAFRVIWGLIGTRHARFGDFVYRPHTVLGYLKDLVRLRHRRYLGHNPAGGSMVLALLVSLTVTALSGMAVYGAEEGAGPLAFAFAGSGEFWEEIIEGVHEFFANLTLVLVGLHVGGVIAESLLHRENLIRAMWTGYKREF